MKKTIISVCSFMLGICLTSCVAAHPYVHDDHPPTPPRACSDHNDQSYVPVVVHDHVYDYRQHSWVWVNTHTDRVDCDSAARILQRAHDQGLDVNYDGYPNCPLRVSYNVYHKSSRVYLTYPAFHIHWGILFNQHHVSFHHRGTLRPYHHGSRHIYHAPTHLRKHNHKSYTHHGHKQNQTWKKKKWHSKTRHSNKSHGTVRVSHHRTNRHHYSGPGKKWSKKKPQVRKKSRRDHQKGTSSKRRSHPRSR